MNITHFPSTERQLIMQMTSRLSTPMQQCIRNGGDIEATLYGEIANPYAGLANGYQIAQAYATTSDGCTGGRSFWRSYTSLINNSTALFSDRSCPWMVCHVLKIAVLRPRATASRSLSWMLRQAYPACKFDPVDTCWRFEEVAEAYPDYLRVICVANPFTRVVDNYLKDLQSSHIDFHGLSLLEYKQTFTEPYQHDRTVEHNFGNFVQANADVGHLWQALGYKPITGWTGLTPKKLEANTINIRREHFEADIQKLFRQIAKRAGVKPVELKSIPCFGGLRIHDIRHFYRTPRIKEIVADIYAEDISKYEYPNP